MPQRLAAFLAGITGASAIALGAFGAHSLKTLLFLHGAHDIWNKAVLYHLVHAVALLWIVRGSSVRVIPFFCWFLGILFFSGSLYMLAITGKSWWGPLTPIGGGLLIAGWLFVAVQKPQ
ncbi:MAG: hypothetical protein A3F67_12190 [Verrucomicrobia bacterium RIFCSPHIGHO2_12_FULL_41_10]|nr:MAG: hypothetical protein A3F67_12190 [Verrucomicrobia bacterium RIFCSPHIGHO2_12_FULL_41_10]HLB32778.1 DUF423 domain-containing protein [Chthoniobacterales bacterium]